MKKIVLMMVMAVAALTSNAQESKWYVGGALGYNWSQTPDASPFSGSKTHGFVIAPEVGYHLTEKWALGMEIEYSYASVTRGSVIGPYTASQHTGFVSPYARFSFAKLGPVVFFADGGFRVGWSDTDYTPWAIGIKPGLCVHLSEKLSFVAHLGQLGYEKYSDGVETAGFSFKGNNLNFGLEFHL